MVHNHYPWQSTCQRLPTVTAKNFTLSERPIVILFRDDNYYSYQDAQTHVFIIVNSFAVILEVEGPNRGNISNGLQRQPKFYHYMNLSLPFCSSMTIMLQIKTIKPMCLTSKLPLVSSSKWQVLPLYSLMISMFSTKTLKSVCLLSNISLSSS